MIDARWVVGEGKPGVPGTGRTSRDQSRTSAMPNPGLGTRLRADTRGPGLRTNAARRQGAEAMAEGQESFWAIVELMGHQKMAGLVTEMTFAGTGMVRVDVPDCGAGMPAFTRMVSPGSIYAVNPVSEEIARGLAARYRPKPFESWELPRGLLPAAAIPCPDDEDLEL